MLWRKVTLIGVGLLGGSLGLAFKRRKLAACVVGYVRREKSISECAALGAVDRATLDLAEAVDEAELIVFCTPIAQMASLARRLAPVLKRGAIVTDVGSVKACVDRQLAPIILRAGGHFVGSHPMAGAEKTGVRAASSHLFDGAVAVVTPSAKSNRKAVAAVERLWRSVGARVLRLKPELHDAMVGRTSHLPHVVAATLAAHVLDSRHAKWQAALCATGFRDTTRIASGSPEMWRDIVLANRANLVHELAVIVDRLEKLRRQLRSGDTKAIEKFLATAKERRDRWCARNAFPSPE